MIKPYRPRIRFKYKTNNNIVNKNCVLYNKNNTTKYNNNSHSVNRQYYDKLVLNI